MRAAGSALAAGLRAVQRGQQVGLRDHADQAALGVDHRDVVLTRGPNVLVGERMVVDLGAGTAAVEGRVRSVFQPGGE